MFSVVFILVKKSQFKTLLCPFCHVVRNHSTQVIRGTTMVGTSNPKGPNFDCWTGLGIISSRTQQVCTTKFVFQVPKSRYHISQFYVLIQISYIVEGFLFQHKIIISPDFVTCYAHIPLRPTCIPHGNHILPQVKMKQRALYDVRGV